MKWGLLGVRLGIVAVNILIVIIILLSFLPLMQNGLRIDMPDTGMGEPTFEDGVLSISAPVEVYNGGFYDIQDLSVSFQLKDNLGVPILDEQSTPVSIPAGRTTTVNIELSIDLEELSSAMLERMVFQSTDLDIVFGMEAYYTMGLVRFEAFGEQEIQNGPLISGYGINGDCIDYVINNETYDIIVPYHFNAAQMIQGQTIELVGSITNSSSDIIGSGTQTITISSYNDGELRFTLTEEAAEYLRTNDDTLTVEVVISFYGAESASSYDYLWDAPEVP